MGKYDLLFEADSTISVAPKQGKYSALFEADSAPVIKPSAIIPKVKPTTPLPYSTTSAMVAPAKATDQSKPDEVSGFFNAIKRGANEAEIVNLMALGRKPTGREIKTIADIKKANAKIQQSEAVKEFTEAKHPVAKWDAWKKNPVEVSAQIGIESLATMLKHGWKRGLSGAGMAAVLAAPTGIGVVPALATGFIGGQTMANYNMETSAATLESFKDAGVDVADEKQLQAAFDNKEIYDKAKSYALKRGLTVGAFDLFSGGIAGKLFGKPVAKAVVKNATETVFKETVKETAKKVWKDAAELGIQTGLEGAGEAAAGLVSKGEVNLNDVIDEIVGGPFTEATTVAAGKIAQGTKDVVTQKPDVPVDQKITDEFEKGFEDVKKTEQALPKDLAEKQISKGEQVPSGFEPVLTDEKTGAVTVRPKDETLEKANPNLLLERKSQEIKTIVEQNPEVPLWLDKKASELTGEQSDVVAKYNKTNEKIQELNTKLNPEPITEAATAEATQPLADDIATEVDSEPDLATKTPDEVISTVQDIEVTPPSEEVVSEPASVEPLANEPVQETPLAKVAAPVEESKPIEEPQATSTPTDIAEPTVTATEVESNVSVQEDSPVESVETIQPSKFTPSTELQKTVNIFTSNKEKNTGSKNKALLNDIGKKIAKEGGKVKDYFDLVGDDKVTRKVFEDTINQRFVESLVGKPKKIAKEEVISEPKIIEQQKDVPRTTFESEAQKQSKVKALGAEAEAKKLMIEDLKLKAPVKKEKKELPVTSKTERITNKKIESLKNERKLVESVIKSKTSTPSQKESAKTAVEKIKEKIRDEEIKEASKNIKGADIPAEIERETTDVDGQKAVKIKSQIFGYEESDALKNTKPHREMIAKLTAKQSKLETLEEKQENQEAINEEKEKIKEIQNNSPVPVDAEKLRKLRASQGGFITIPDVNIEGMVNATKEFVKKLDKRGIINKMVGPEYATLVGQSNRLKTLAHVQIDNILKNTTDLEREALTFLQEKTNVPKQYKRPDLQKELDAIRKDPERKAKFDIIITDINKFNKTYFGFMKKFADKVGERENYVLHDYKSKKGLSDANDRDMLFENKSLKERKFQTYEQAAGKGYIASTLDIAKLMDKAAQTAITTATNNLYIDMLKGNNKAGVKLLGESNEATKKLGWKTSKYPELEGMAYDPSIEVLLDSMFGKRWDSKPVVIAEAVQGAMKQAILSLGLFHHLDLTKTSIANIGFKKTYNALNVRDFLATTMGDKTRVIRKKIDEVSDFVTHGGVIGAISDVHNDLIDKGLGLIEKGGEKIGGKIGKAIAGAPKEAHRAWHRALWDYLQNTYKLASYQDYVNKTLAKNPDATAEQITDFKRQAAAAVNDGFGGQNFDLLMTNKKHLQTAQALMLSPDYSFSNARQFLSAFNLLPAVGSKEGRALRGKLGRNFIVGAVLRIVLLENLANMYNRMKDDDDEWEDDVRKLKSKIADKEEEFANKDYSTYEYTETREKAMEQDKDTLSDLKSKAKDLDKEKPSYIFGEKPFKQKAKDIFKLTMFGNTAGHKFDLYGGKDENGVEKYWGTNKQLLDIPEFFVDFKHPTGPQVSAEQFVKRAGAKASPFIQAGSLITRGKSASGFENKKITEAKDKELSERIGVTALEVFKQSFSPISASQAMDKNREFNVGDLALPRGKGGSNYQLSKLTEHVLKEYVDSGNKTKFDNGVAEMIIMAKRNRLYIDKRGIVKMQKEANKLRKEELTRNELMKKIESGEAGSTIEERKAMRNLKKDLRKADYFKNRNNIPDVINRAIDKTNRKYERTNKPIGE